MQDLQEAFGSIEIESSLRQITQKYQLHVNQGSRLMESVDNVILGLLPYNKFSGAIKHALEIDEETSNNITNDVNQQIYYHKVFAILLLTLLQN